MEYIGGIYAGNSIWASTYNAGKFVDKKITIETASACSFAYITSDLEVVTGQSRKEIALAYYAYCLMAKCKKTQTRVFEILCDGCCVELYVFEGLEKKNTVELLHQKEDVPKEETEKFLATKYIFDILKDRFEDNRGLCEAYRAFKDYEYSIISDPENTSDLGTEELINNIYKKINFEEKDLRIEFLGEYIEIKKESYVENISEDICDAYLPLIRKLVERVSNNFEKEDYVFLFIKNFSNDVSFKRRVTKIAEDHCIHIEVKPYTGSFISRGNAYLNYLHNNLLKNRIRENLGRFTVLFESNQTNLQQEKGNVDFICNSDLEDRYQFTVCDTKTKMIVPVELAVPFSINGSSICLKYSYEGEGVKIVLEDNASGESVQKVLSYSI